MKRSVGKAISDFEAQFCRSTWIRVSPRGKQEEPESLVAIKGEIERRWGTIDLLDILKYAEFGTDFISEFTSVATRENLSKDVLRRRLLLLFGPGTNSRGRAGPAPLHLRRPQAPHLPGDRGAGARGSYSLHL
ncbi:hypothetical protein [Streptomyces sp. NPDC054786]